MKVRHATKRRNQYCKTRQESMIIGCLSTTYADMKQKQTDYHTALWWPRVTGGSINDDDTARISQQEAG